MGLAGWNGSLFLTIYDDHPILWGRAVFAFGVLNVVGLLLFSSAFPQSERNDIPPKRIDGLVIALGCFLFLASWTRLIVRTVRVVDGYITGSFSPLVIVYMAFYFGLLIWSGVRIWKKGHLLRGQQKTQARYVFASILLFFFPVVITQIILPNIFSIFKFNYLGPLFSIPMAALITYAIIRHRLMDIRVVMQRGLIYSGLLTVIMAFYFSLLIPINIFLKKSFESDFIALTITAIAGIFGAPQIEKYFKKVTDKIFFKNNYDYSEAIQQLSVILNRNMEPENLTIKISDTLQRIFKAKTVRLNIDPTEPSPAVAEGDEQSRPVIPIILENEFLGSLTMGEKLSGDEYSDGDLKLLRTFANQAAVAIKKAELYEKVKKHSEELEVRVRERTQQIETLHNDQRQMMFDISHNLQTALTVVRGELTTLRHESKNAKKIAALENSIDKVSKFIYDLLLLARLESDREEWHPEAVDLSVLVHDILEYVAVIANEKHITITSHIMPDVIVDCEKDKIEELLVNLVSNALKYTEFAPVREVFVVLEKIGAKAMLTVKDTGIGISAEDLPHIFDRFYRVKQAQKMRGTGLGLAISKSIVQKHGGTITAESTAGKGSTFIVTLPVRAGTADAKKQSLRPAVNA